MREIRRIRTKETRSRNKRRRWFLSGMLLLALLVIGGIAASKWWTPESDPQTIPGMFVLTEKTRPNLPPPALPTMHTTSEDGEASTGPNGEISPESTPAISDPKASQAAPDADHPEEEKEDHFTFYKTLPAKKEQMVPLTPEQEKVTEVEPMEIPPHPLQQKGGDQERRVSIPHDDASSGGYTIQVGALKERRSAEELASALRNKGHNVHIVPLTQADGGVLYRVRVGRFPNRVDAQKKADGLSHDGLNTFVLKEE